MHIEHAIVLRLDFLRKAQPQSGDPTSNLFLDF